MADGEVLAGGMANAGGVTRHGDVVHRPAPPNVRTIHALLRALADAGFTGAPDPVRIRPDGREELAFVPGDVAIPPFPVWSQEESALRSVGALLRRLHDAAAQIPGGPALDLGDDTPDSGPGPDSGQRADRAPAWAPDLADPHGGTVLCHNDVCPENVVFRDGRAVALIDFDFAAPGRPVWDLAMTARHWVPMVDPESAAATGRAGLDTPRRLRLLADAYGLSPSDRMAFTAVSEQVNAACRAFNEARVAAGEEVFVRAWTENGGAQRVERIAAWLAATGDAFTEALLA